MKVDLQPGIDAAAGAARRVMAYLGEQRFWVQLGGMTLLALSTLGIVGRSAYARAAAFDGESARLAAIENGLDRWTGNVVWPAPEETATWRESETFFRVLGNSSVAPLTLANQIARRGEEISRAEVRIRLTSPDTAYIPPPERIGEWMLTSGRAALVVEISGTWSAIISFLGALPPQVEVAGLQLSAPDERASMRLLLLSRELSQVPTFSQVGP